MWQTNNISKSRAIAEDIKSNKYTHYNLVTQRKYFHYKTFKFTFSSLCRLYVQSPKTKNLHNKTSCFWDSFSVNCGFEISHYYHYTNT